MSQAVLAFGGLRILVESEPGHLGWLREFMGPAAEWVDGPGADWQVTLAEDRRGHQQALDRGPRAGTLEAFVFDARTVGLPRWQGADVTLFDAERGIFYEAARDRRAVTILSTPGNLHGRTALMRVVRELGTNQAQRHGGVLLHAAAVAVGDRGIVISGPKRSGKTTLLLHVLRARSARYLANDRVLVPPGAGPVTAVAVPTIVALRRGTLDFFPRLAERLAASGHRHQLTVSEAEAAARPVEPRGKPDSVSPAQLCRLLGVEPAARCEVSAIVFPRISHTPGAFALRRLAAADVAPEIADMLFGVRGGRWASSVFDDPGGPPPPDLDMLARRCRDITSRVPCLECRLGIDGFEAADTADELIASVLG